ncbi:MAG: response regulator transcription factor [Chthoniobacteraceae bacterium]
MTPPIQLLLIDDHAVMRAGLANMLNANPAFRVVAGADDGTVALALFRRHQPDVTLLDVAMPGMDGIECLRLLRAEFPEARVLMLSSSDAEEDIVQALEAGACGYVIKTSRPTELTAAILAAHAGQRVISPAIEQRLRERAGGALLTPREIEVLALLRKGLSNPEIGRLLGITTRTAKAHVAAILEKLEAADRTEAVTRAFERGLLKL